MGTVVGFIILAIIVIAVVNGVKSEKVQAQQQAAGAKKIVCPHCGTAGQVTSRAAQVKQGISGGKATGAVLTGGLSLLATGLSRKQKGRQLTCGNCRMSWFVA